MILCALKLMHINGMMWYAHMFKRIHPMYTNLCVLQSQICTFHPKKKNNAKALEWRKFSWLIVRITFVSLRKCSNNNRFIKSVPDVCILRPICSIFLWNMRCHLLHNAYKREISPWFDRIHYLLHMCLGHGMPNSIDYTN